MQDKILTENLTLIDEEKPLREGWRFIQLGDICTLQRGYDLPGQDWVKGIYPIVGSNGIIGFHNEFRAKAPGVVTGRSGTIGKVHYIDSDYFPHNTSLYVKDFKGNNPKLVKYLLDSIDLKSLGEQTTAVPSLDRKNAHKVKVAFPLTIEEQRRIASVLDEQMKAVEQARLAIEEQLKAANLLPNAFLRVLFESEEAQNWQKRKLGEVCTIKMGQSPSGTSYNNKGIGEPLLNGPAEFGRVYPTAVQWTTEPVRFSEEGDILFCVRGSTTGRKNISDKRYCIGRGLAAIRGKDQQATTEFLMYVLDFVTLNLLGESAGSTFPNLSADKIENYKTYFPRIEEQTKIAKRINEQRQAAETLKKSLTEKLEAIKKLPAALLRKAFVGEI